MFSRLSLGGLSAPGMQNIVLLPLDLEIWLEGTPGITHVISISLVVLVSSRVMTSISLLLGEMLLSFSSTVMTLLTALALAKIGFTMGEEEVTGAVVASEAFGDGSVDEVIRGGGKVGTLTLLDKKRGLVTEGLGLTVLGFGTEIDIKLGMTFTLGRVPVNFG